MIRNEQPDERLKEALSVLVQEFSNPVFIRELADGLANPSHVPNILQLTPERVRQVVEYVCKYVPTSIAPQLVPTISKLRRMESTETLVEETGKTLEPQEWRSG